jgi:hypothetical protein
MSAEQSRGSESRVCQTARIGRRPRAKPNWFSFANVTPGQAAEKLTIL